MDIHPRGPTFALEMYWDDGAQKEMDNDDNVLSVLEIYEKYHMKGDGLKVLRGLSEKLFEKISTIGPFLAQVDTDGRWMYQWKWREKGLGWISFHWGVPHDKGMEWLRDQQEEFQRAIEELNKNGHLKKRDFTRGCGNSLKSYIEGLDELERKNQVKMETVLAESAIEENCGASECVSETSFGSSGEEEEARNVWR